MNEEDLKTFITESEAIVNEAIVNKAIQDLEKLNKELEEIL